MALNSLAYFYGTEEEAEKQALDYIRKLRFDEHYSIVKGGHPRRSEYVVISHQEETC